MKNESRDKKNNLKTYRKPNLREYGNIKDMTHAMMIMGPDDGATGMPSRTSA